MATEDQCIKRLRSRLNRWELPHLRQLAADLHEKLEAAEQRALYYEQCADAAEHRADMFQDLLHEVQEAAEGCGRPITIGLTVDGAMGVLEGGAA